MHAFDYISVLFSFVYGAAITHILATIGDIATAWHRVKPSWLNAGWMVCALLAVAAWWLGTWDLRSMGEWSMATTGVFFAMAAVMYLQVRLVCPRIPEEAPIDLQAFHRTEGRKYMGAYLIVMVITIATNSLFFADGADWVVQNNAVLPMALGTLAAAIFTGQRWVQVGGLIVQLAMWGWYFAALQPPLKG